MGSQATSQQMLTGICGVARWPSRKKKVRSRSSSFLVPSQPALLPSQSCSRLSLAWQPRWPLSSSSWSSDRRPGPSASCKLLRSSLRGRARSLASEAWIAFGLRTAHKRWRRAMLPKTWRIDSGWTTGRCPCGSSLPFPTDPCPRALAAPTVSDLKL
eukprot:s2034_g5.t1